MRSASRQFQTPASERHYERSEAVLLTSRRDRTSRISIPMASLSPSYRHSFNKTERGVGGGRSGEQPTSTLA